MGLFGDILEGNPVTRGIYRGVKSGMGGRDPFNPSDTSDIFRRGIGNLTQGKYRQFGTSDEEIARLLAQQQRTSGEANRYQFERGLSALANDAAQRGMGSSGAMAAGVPGLQEGIMRQRAQQDLAMQQLAMQMRNARQYVYRPSLFEQLLPAAGQIGGAAIGAG